MSIYGVGGIGLAVLTSALSLYLTARAGREFNPAAGAPAGGPNLPLTQSIRHQTQNWNYKAIGSGIAFILALIGAYTVGSDAMASYI